MHPPICGLQPLRCLDSAVLYTQVNELRTNEPQCQIHLVATKADLLDSGNGSGGSGGGGKRIVSTAAAQQFAAGVGATLSSTSAKTGQGVAVSDARRGACWLAKSCCYAVTLDCRPAFIARSCCSAGTHCFAVFSASGAVRKIRSCHRDQELSERKMSEQTTCALLAGAVPEHRGVAGGQPGGCGGDAAAAGPVAGGGAPARKRPPQP